MFSARHRLSALTAVAAALFSFGCTEPTPPGTLKVNYSTQLGDELPFTWQFTVDGANLRQVNSGNTGVLRLDSVAAGEHRMVVSGLPSLCTTGEDDRLINVPSGGETQVDLAVKCARLTGDISLTVTTSGVEQDPNGYVVSLDGAAGPAIPPGFNTSLMIPRVAAGSHTITLSGVASNCEITNGPAFTVFVNAEKVTTFSIAVLCFATKGTIRILAPTTGSPVDPSGYRVTVGTNPFPALVLPNGSTQVPQLSAGSYTLTLSDVEPNCTAGTTTRTVSVVAGTTVDASFDVACGPYAATTAALDASDPVGDTLPNTTALTSPKGFDITSVKTGYGPGFMTLTMKFANPLGTQQYQGYIDLDLDEDPNTGFDPVMNFFGGNAPQGSDAYIDFFLSGSPAAFLVTANDDRQIRIVAGGDSVILFIPLSHLEDDGNLTITSIIGTLSRPTDWIPNSAVLVSHIPPGAPVTAASVRTPTVPRTTGAKDFHQSPRIWKRPPQ
jgi:hypothetical protein